MAETQDNLLGTYLKDRRGKLDPAACGIAPTRRRTPGLRREEVAQRANVSATWYTWLEQGRGGAPSADVLDRIARALSLTQVEREHLFLLAQHRPPEVSGQPAQCVTPQLQRVLDSLVFSPAMVRNAVWDVVAWNSAATVLMTDYAALPPDERNILKIVFRNAEARRHMVNWEDNARVAVAAFRSEAVKAGMPKAAQALVDELSFTSPEFLTLWRDYDVRNYGEGIKRFRHDGVGEITMEYSSLTIDGMPDLGLAIFTPATPEDSDKVSRLLQARRPPPV